VLNRKGVLFTRTDDYRGVGWQKAQQAEAIIAAGRGGVPLATYARRFQSQFGGPASMREMMEIARR
jgi:hypothetical protein